LQACIRFITFRGGLIACGLSNKGRLMNASRVRRVLAAVLMCAYIASYVGLSSAGFARADATDTEGYYFVEPVSPDTYRVHRRLSIFYAPAIAVERVLGMGRDVGKEPLWGLE
jgi:hypothetical protein